MENLSVSVSATTFWQMIFKSVLLMPTFPSQPSLAISMTPTLPSQMPTLLWGT